MAGPITAATLQQATATTSGIHQQQHPPFPPPPPTHPVEGQTYCLRWNNHQTNLVEIMHELHKDNSYVDCTLVVDDDQFKAHRVVLSANSPYFQTILQDVPQDHCSIILPGVKGFQIAALLKYMYTGETTVTKSQEPDILLTAKELQVKGLYDNLMKFNQKDVQQNYASTTPHSHTPYAAAATSSSSASSTRGAPVEHKMNGDAAYGAHNSSSVISTSTHHISPNAAISSSSSPPPYTGAADAAAAAAAIASNYQATPYTKMYRSKSPQMNEAAAETNNHHHQNAASAAAAVDLAAEHPAWPLTPSAAAAMLNSVYESAADMNPLKRKKLSAITSMFRNRDTPILRNVLANPADSSQQAPPSALMLPGVLKNDKQNADANNTNYSFNGSDYSSEKYEPLSPHTDRSFDDEAGNNSSMDKKPEWKRYKQYTRNDMMCAIQCVREGMSALQASRKFGLPSRTLYDKVRKLNINTGRGTGRTPKRSSPGSVETTPTFPYHHGGHGGGYGQNEQQLLSSHMKHDAHIDSRDERDNSTKERAEAAAAAVAAAAAAHHLPAAAAGGIPHSTLLDHAFLERLSLESRSGDIAGREALHAMALAAAAHAAANRMTNSPNGVNGHGMVSLSAAAAAAASAATRRTPSPAAAAAPMHHYDSPSASSEQHEMVTIKREIIDTSREERDADDEDDHVEDLSVTRKMYKRAEAAAYTTPPPAPASAADDDYMENNDDDEDDAASAAGVIVPNNKSSTD